MDIFKNYTTDDLVINKPLEVDNLGTIYPILVKDYKKYASISFYLTYSKKHFNIPKEEPLLFSLISIMASFESQTKHIDFEKGFENTILNLCNLFSIIFRKQINLSGSMGNKQCEFSSEDKTVVINNSNFELLRKIVQKMTLLQEPKIYEREIDRKWHEKAVKAKTKNNKNIDFGEIMLIVSQNMKWTLDYIYNELNIFQLYCYYSRICHIYDFETTRLFATVSSKIKITPSIDNIFNDLYKDPYADLTVKNQKGFFSGLT